MSWKVGLNVNTTTPPLRSLLPPDKRNPPPISHSQCSNIFVISEVTRPLHSRPLDLLACSALPIHVCVLQSAFNLPSSLRVHARVHAVHLSLSSGETHIMRFQRRALWAADVIQSGSFRTSRFGSSTMRIAVAPHQGGDRDEDEGDKGG